MSRRYRIKLHNQKNHELKMIKRHYLILRIIGCIPFALLALWFTINNFELYKTDPIIAMIFLVVVIAGMFGWSMQMIKSIDKREKRYIDKTLKWYKNKYNI